MKSHKIIFSLLALGSLNGLLAQTSSYYGIGSSPAVTGVHNSGFGWHALNGGSPSGTENTATGYEAMNQATTGSYNTASGKGALYSNNKGIKNTASGFEALYNSGCASCAAGADNNTASGTAAIRSNQSGKENTANGNSCMYNNTTGYQNVAEGYKALYTNSTGTNNVALGSNALFGNTIGSENTAAGKEALHDNTQGKNNTAIGFQALYSNKVNGTTYGSNNTAVGYTSLFSNLSGSNNTAGGRQSLNSNLTGNNNVASGFQSAYKNQYGDNNVAIGYQAAYYNTSSAGNVAIGNSCLLNNTGSNNTAIGYFAAANNGSQQYNTVLGFGAFQYSSPGHNNTILGANADVIGTYTNQSVIGYMAVGEAGDDKIQLGNSATGYVVETQNAFVVPSDGRFKYNVTEDIKGLEFINRLRPVAYNLDAKAFTAFITKKMSDTLRKKHMAANFKPLTDTRQTGFIAQEVEKAAKDLNYDFNGVNSPENEDDHYSIAYSMFVVPLVKAVQEQQQMIDEQKQITQQLTKDLAQQMTEVNQLTSRSAIETGLKTNIGDQKKFSMMAEPNPFSHETVISYTLPADISTAFLTICDLSGTQLLSYPLNEKELGSVNVTSEKLSSGMYIYSIISGGKILGSKRLIVSGK